MAQCRRSWKRKPGKPAFFVSVSPGGPPASHVPRRIKASDAVVDHLLAAKGELGNKGRKDIVRLLNRAETLCPRAQPCEGRSGHVSQRHDSLASSRLGGADGQGAS